MSAKDTPREYFIIFICLLGLTGLTAGAAFINFGPFSFPIALIIAFIKATLVVWFFMHLRHMSKLARIFAAGGVFWLATLLGLTFSDYLTREPVVPPGQQTWIRQSASFDALRDNPRYPPEKHSVEHQPAERH